MKTLAGFPRTGDTGAFTNNAAVVQAAFNEEMLESGKNSELVELADDHVLVLRVTAHHVPTVKPLTEVHDQIKEELARAAREELSDEAASAFLAGIEQPAADPAALAAAHSGTWAPAAWVERTDSSRADRGPSSGVRIAENGAGRRCARASRSRERQSRGARAVERRRRARPTRSRRRSATSGNVSSPSSRRYAELTSYVGTLREQATVRIPDDILNPQY